MAGRFTTGLIAAFLGAGVLLFAMNELGTVQPGILLVYFGLWLAVGIVGIVLLRPRAPRSERSAAPNPFERMWDSERERARAILNARLAGREVPTEDSNWLSILLERYAPLLSQSQQLDRFTEYLESVPVKAPKETTHIKDPSLAEPPLPGERVEELHDGPAVVLARAARRQGFDVTRDGSSWFGGLPALGGQLWPLDDDRRPMTPLAQIDLTGLAGHLNVRGLPETGSLAFFAALPETDDWVGRVVYIRTPGSPSQPPGPLRPVLNHSLGGPLRRGEPGDGQRLYPRMAMQLAPIHASGRTDPKAFAAEVADILGEGHRFGPSVRQMSDSIPNLQEPWNRDSLLRFLHGARLSLGASDQAEMALRKMQASHSRAIKEFEEKLTGEPADRELLQTRLQNTQSSLRHVNTMLADVPAGTRRLEQELSVLEAWSRSGDRWGPLTDDDRKTLAPLLEPWTQSNGLGNALLERTHGILRSMADGIDESVLVLAVAEDELFNMLPRPIADALNGAWLQPSDRAFHQMFGCPDSVQVAAEENEHARLLLQLQCDKIAGFHWGDGGVLQFWIRPEDLEAGSWDQAYMTFEGH